MIELTLTALLITFVFGVSTVGLLALPWSPEELAASRGAVAAVPAIPGAVWRSLTQQGAALRQRVAVPQLPDLSLADLQGTPVEGI